MPIGHLLIDGRRFMVIDESEYSRLVSESAGASVVHESNLPQLPKPGADGSMPAMEFARVSLARKLIIERSSRGWTQAELARRAGIPVETVNRLENARNTAKIATAKKIQAAFDSQPVSGRNRTVRMSRKRAG
ncbi:MAG: helix-turn-helix transcriptional regulator [Tepidisphaeraceae bacterium]|jgi:DNA-binding XRE family transcriptional regulator